MGSKGSLINKDSRPSTDSGSGRSSVCVESLEQYPSI
jgi:hypothetical protein